MIRRPVLRGRDERGQILVIVAGGMFALLVFLGLIIDGGNAFLNRRDAQNTADLAALAGTRLIASGYTTSDTVGVNNKTRGQINQEILTSVKANGCLPDGTTPCTWQAWFVGPSGSGPIDLASVTDVGSSLPANTIGVRVNVNRQPGTFLARLANIQTWDVNTEAIALAESPAVATADRLLPIAMARDPNGYNPRQVYDLTDGKDLSGGFGYISWTGLNNPNALATSLCTPDNPSFYLPAQFDADPGSSNSDGVRACLQKWIASGQTVLVPIYSSTTGHGNGGKYTIVGIAAFVVTAVDQPAVKNIRGYFVEMYQYTNPVPGGANSGPPKPNDTSFLMGLVK